MTNNSKITLRNTIVKLYFEKKKTQNEISNLLDVSQSMVSFWIVRYKKTNSLNNLPKDGRPSFISKEDTKKLKKALLGFPPPRFGGKSLGWTTKMAIQYAKDEFGITYSMRRMQELFHKFGLNLITPRTEHKQSSKLVRQVYRDDFKKNSKMNIWIAPSLISMK